MVLTIEFLSLSLSIVIFEFFPPITITRSIDSSFLSPNSPYDYLVALCQLKFDAPLNLTVAHEVYARNLMLSVSEEQHLNTCRVS